jgi:uncharacterized repeat protein (TIGR03943 family)
MKTLFNRWLPFLTLAAWSSVLLIFHANNRVNALLAPQFRTYALIAGIVLGGLALVFLLFKADASCCSSAECGHSLSRFATGRILTFLILIVPVTVSAFYSPQGFSGTAVRNRGITDDIAALGLKDRKPLPPPDLALPKKDQTMPAPAATPAPAENPVASQPPAPTTPAPANAQPPSSEPAPADYLQRTADGRIVAEVLDLLYAAQDNVLRKDFENKPVQLIGQFMPDKTSANQASRFKAVRMFMYCCAADSRPIATLVEADKMPDFPEMTWVKITGTAQFPMENGRRVSVLKAEKVEKTEPPEEAMLY